MPQLKDQGLDADDIIDFLDTNYTKVPALSIR
jgi:hypothetical protein